MTWTLLVALVIALGLCLGAAVSRRHELARMRRALAARDRTERAGAARAELEIPFVDLSRCLGCGACVRACPEDGVLALIHGQALVVNGSRCRGHARCESECPVGAIKVALADAAARDDVPALTEELEAIGTSGLFLAGEITARALIKTAIEQGTAVANAVARRVRGGASDVLDVAIVGAGPAGLACALEAQWLGLTFVVLDRESAVGGTVARYPRQKLVVTRPIELPQFGALERTSYEKEELVELWTRIAREARLPIRGGETLEELARASDGAFVVRSTGGATRARCVVLAIGRRGTPRRLGVSGEDLPHVAYALLDARSHAGRRSLVVGGGESAVETALALAEQADAEVVLAHRGESLFRISPTFESRLEEAVAAGRVRVSLETTVLAIHRDHVDVSCTQGAAADEVTRLRIDDVFVMIGGEAPKPLLERCGVSFDPELRPASEPIAEQGTGLVRALAIGFALALATLVIALAFADYYLLPREARPAHELHSSLRPGRGVGLALGFASAALVGVNLAYLLRRARKLGVTFGSLSTWMTSHVATGILALLVALLHGGLDARDTVGGHALLALAFLLVTGAIGRYFYAYVPRAANGRELELAEVQRALARAAHGVDHRARDAFDAAGARVRAIVERERWRGTFLGRVTALVRGQRALRRELGVLRDEARRDGLQASAIHELSALALRAHRAALATAHFEDLRALLATWRWFHRWVAALFVVLLVLHVVYAYWHGSPSFQGGAP